MLNSLVNVADSEPDLLSLVSYITRNELPVNRKLADRFIDSFKSARDRSTTAKMLHLAALANDAAVYQRAVETALESWRGGYLARVSPQELHAILEGEFWILSSATRSSGAGFVLKRTLAAARRERKRQPVSNLFPVCDEEDNKMTRHRSNAALILGA